MQQQFQHLLLQNQQLQQQINQLTTLLTSNQNSINLTPSLTPTTPFSLNSNLNNSSILNPTFNQYNSIPLFPNSTISLFPNTTLLNNPFSNSNNNISLNSNNNLSINSNNNLLLNSNNLSPNLNNSLSNNFPLLSDYSSEEENNENINDVYERFRYYKINKSFPNNTTAAQKKWIKKKEKDDKYIWKNNEIYRNKIINKKQPKKVTTLNNEEKNLIKNKNITSLTEIIKINNFQLIPKLSIRNKILNKYHTHYSVHGGRDVMEAAISKKYWWKKLR
ncbi:hypothetical protein ABK040_011403 [Willaertia magna]